MTTPIRLLAALLIAAAPIYAVPAAAEPQEWPEVVSKRLKPPAPGTTKRITVQLTELPEWPPIVPRSPIPADPSALPPVGQAPHGYEWYWAAVSPKLADAGPTRVREALATLDRTPSGIPLATPRLQSLQQIADSYGTEILTATVGTPVSPALVLAMISVESSGRSAVVSSAGAVGLMQLIPATAERFGVADSSDPSQNIRGGVAYMDWLLREFDGDVVLALAGYNAGEGAVRKNAGVPPYAETRAYVPKVLAAWTVARGLCMTPPDLITDPCVFVGGRTARSG